MLASFTTEGWIGSELTDGWSGLEKTEIRGLALTIAEPELKAIYGFLCRNNVDTYNII